MQLGLRDKLGARAPRVRDKQVQQAVKAAREARALLVRREMLAALDPQAFKETRVKWDFLDQLVKPGQRDFRDFKVKLVKLEAPDQLAKPGALDCKVPLAFKDSRAARAKPGVRAKPGTKVRPEARAPQGRA